jgi:hypothetical protein
MQIDLHEDVHSYENKFLGNFTKRQVLCIILALCVIAPTFIVLFLLVGSIDLASIVSLLLGVPIIACGIFKINGVPLEKMIWYKLVTRKCPKQRVYKGSNCYVRIAELTKELERREQTIREQEEKNAKKEARKNEKTKKQSEK